MSSDTAPDDLVDQLLFEFIDRQQAGESPSISEYCRKYPDHAEEIRDVLSTLSLLDNAASGGPVEKGALPEKIGDYQILHEIGRGGMGVVYEALHRSLGRRVALKVLPGRLSQDTKALARFHREARAVAKLHHTNIVPMFEVGDEDGRSFIAMQLISGQSLDRVLADRKQQSREECIESGSNSEQRFHWIAGIGKQAGHALAYAHSRGIIHRDVKPSNIILDESGVTWLTDFGLAKTDDEELTQAGDFVGTLRYMAPERFRDECDERADIYALGLTLYELLTHSVAFKGTDRLKLIQQIDNVQPIPPSHLVPNVPQDLETIILKAINKDPSGRYPSANEFADDLGRFVDDRPIRARRQSALEKLYRWSRRNKGLAAAMSTVALLLMLIAVGTTIMSIRSDRLQRIAENRGKQLRQNLYFAEMNIAGQAASSRYGTPTVRQSLESWIPDSNENDLRGWEWYYLYALSHRERFATPALNGWTWSVDFNPAGTEYVNCVNGWGIQVRSAESGEVIREKFLGAARYVDWSPDGKKIAVAGFNNDIKICSATSLNVVGKMGGGFLSEVWCVQWSPDGTKLATCRRDVEGERNEVQIWEEATENLFQLLQGHEGAIHEVSWSPNGLRLATGGSDNVRIWDASTGEQQLQISTSASSVCWSPDGCSLAIGNQETLMVVNAKSGKIIESFEGHSNLGALRMRWRPNHSQLACGHGNGTVTMWDIATGSKLRTFYGHSGSVRDIEWNPSGTQIISSGLDNTVRVWEIDARDHTQILPINVAEVEWDLDGEQVAAAGDWNGVVAILHLTNGKIQIIDEQARRADKAAINPDGKRIAYGGRDFLRIWDRATDTIQTLDESDWFKSVSWNHDGNRLAACTLSNRIFLWDCLSEKTTFLDVEENLECVDWSPDGDRLAIALSNGMVSVRKSDGTIIWQKQRNFRISEIRWRPDGSQLASAENGAIVIWNAKTGQEIITLDALKEEFVSVDWSPDFNRFVSGSSSSVAIWDPVSGDVATKLNTDGASCVRWSHDGYRIIAARGESGANVWDANCGYRAERNRLEVNGSK